MSNRRKGAALCKATTPQSNLDPTIDHVAREVNERPTAVRLSWESFADESDPSLISLRKLVFVGEIYTRWDSAVRALKRSGLDFSAVQRKSGGRPTTDYLIAPVSAAIFCQSARTENGKSAGRVIASHHIAFQARADTDVEPRPSVPPRRLASTTGWEAMAFYLQTEGERWTVDYRRRFMHRMCEIGIGTDLPLPELATTLPGVPPGTWLSPTGIGKLCGKSPSAIGVIVTALGIRHDGRYSRPAARLDASGKAWPSQDYNVDAIALILGRVNREDG